MNEQVDKPEDQAADHSVDQQTSASMASEKDTRADDGSSLLKDIGRQLRKARKASGENLDDLVRELKLRKVYLQALEKGDWDALPDKVYAVGFLRQYAAHLGLDLDKEIDHIKNRQYKLTRPLTFPDPPVAPSRPWAWIAGAAFIVLFIGFNVFNHNNDDADSIAPEPQSMQQPAELNPASSSGSSAAALSEQAPMPPAADARLPSPTDAVQNMDHQPSVMDDSGVPIAKPAQTKPVEAILPLHIYRFDAVDDAVWLQIFLPDTSGVKIGELRKEVLLQAGHHLTLNEPVKRIWVTTGNAGALQISVDGKILHSAGSLGSIGKVLHDYPVSAEE